METARIIDEIMKLSIAERFTVVENILESIKKETTRETGMSEAARALQRDYTEDEDLTAFTALDADDFYETKRNH